MQCKVIWGSVAEAKDAFNKWAKGKALARDVIVHSHIIVRVDRIEPVDLVIAVFYPEGEYW